MHRTAIYRDVDAERKRQDELWGHQNDHTPLLWLAIAGEEFGEVSKATLTRNQAELMTELTQLVAVLIHWLECDGGTFTMEVY